MLTYFNYKPTRYYKAKDILKKYFNTCEIKISVVSMGSKKDHYLNVQFPDSHKFVNIMKIDLFKNFSHKFYLLLKIH